MTEWMGVLGALERAVFVINENDVFPILCVFKANAFRD